MSFARTSDGINLFYESAGSGTPIIFVHEFGGSHWSWEPQLNFFARRHQCFTVSRISCYALFLLAFRHLGPAGFVYIRHQ